MSPHRLRLVLEWGVVALTVVWAWVAVTDGLDRTLFAIFTSVVIAGNFVTTVWALRDGVLRAWAATVLGMWKGDPHWSRRWFIPICLAGTTALILNDAMAPAPSPLKWILAIVVVSTTAWVWYSAIWRCRWIRRQ